MQSIRMKIMVALVTVSIVLGALLSYMSLSVSKDTIQSEVQDKLSRQAQNSADEIEKIISRIESIAQSLAISVSTTINIDSLALNNETEDIYVQSYLNMLDDMVIEYASLLEHNYSAYVVLKPELSNTYVYQSLAYLDDSGKNYEIIKDKLPVEFLADSKNPETQWYYAPVNTQKGVWSQPYEDVFRGGKVITYSTPIIYNSEIIGIAAVDLNFEVFSEIVNSIKVYDTGYAFMLDDRYNYLVHPVLPIEDNLGTVKNGSYKFMVEEMNKNQRGILYYTFGGVEKILGYADISNGWTLAVASPITEVYMPISEMQTMILAIGMISIVISIIISIIVGKQISKPVVGVTNILKRISNLNLTANVEENRWLKYNDETGYMARELRNMRKTLECFVKELKRHVLKLNEDSENLRTATFENSQTIEQVSQIVSELADGAYNQNSETNNSMNHLEKLNEQIEFVVENTTVMTEHTERVKEVNLRMITTLGKLNDNLGETNNITLIIHDNDIFLP